MPLLGYRDLPRRRHVLSPRVVLLLRPFFRYSPWRDAWILRIVGERHGPVLQVAPEGEPRLREETRPLRRLTELRAPVALLATCGIAAALVLGFLAARSAAGGSSTPTLARAVSAGGLAVSFPSGWSLRPAQDTAQLGLIDGIVAASGGHLIAVGRAVTIDPSLLPPVLLALIGRTPTPQLVTLRGTTFYRYLNLRFRGGPGVHSIYAVPTVEGTVLAVCRTPKPDAGFASTCERVVRSIRLRSGSLAPGLLPAYASALSAVLDRLNAVRVGWGSQLRTARTVRARAVAARALAAAHAQAAAALATLPAGPARSANAALAAALSMDASAYRALARAAAHRRVRAYRTAAAAVAGANAALSSAEAQLRAAGYRVSGA